MFKTFGRATKINVVLGTNNLKTPDEGRLLFNVTREGIFQHPKYNPSTVAYDIAVIRLPERVEFTGTLIFIRIKICLNDDHICNFPF